MSVRLVVPVQESHAGQTLQSLWENFTLIQVLFRKQVLLSQIGMNRREHSFIAEGSRSGFDAGNQLWCVVVTGLGEMHLVVGPEGGSYLAIARVEVIRRGAELSRGQGLLSPKAATLFSGSIVLDEVESFHLTGNVRFSTKDEEPCHTEHRTITHRSF